MAKSEDPYFRLRVPEDLKAKIAEAADASHRSMTAEIIDRLQRSFGPSADRRSSSLDEIILNAVNQITAAPYMGNSEVQDALWNEYDRLKKQEAENARQLLVRAAEAIRDAHTAREAAPPDGMFEGHPSPMPPRPKSDS